MIVKQGSVLNVPTGLQGSKFCIGLYTKIGTFQVFETGYNCFITFEKIDSGRVYKIQDESILEVAYFDGWTKKFVMYDKSLVKLMEIRKENIDEIGFEIQVVFGKP
jgi:hypothetical protein